MELPFSKELILAIFIIMIIAINIWLFSSLNKNNSQSTFQILKKSAETLRNPFKKENENLEELSRIVKNFSSDEKNKEKI